jgi:hypothetical protein
MENGYSAKMVSSGLSCREWSRLLMGNSLRSLSCSTPALTEQFSVRAFFIDFGIWKWSSRIISLLQA